MRKTIGYFFYYIYVICEGLLNAIKSFTKSNEENLSGTTIGIIVNYILAFFILIPAVFILIPYAIGYFTADTIFDKNDRPEFRDFIK